MKRLISILRDNNIECLPNERFTLDVEMFPDNGEEHHFPKQVLLESGYHVRNKRCATDTL